MMREYEMTVSVPAPDEGTMQNDSIIANAAKYLAYADQTDTFGYHGYVTHAHVMGYTNDDESANVYMRIRVPIPGPDYMQEFEDELDALAHVRAYVMLDETNLMYP